MDIQYVHLSMRIFTRKKTYKFKGRIIGLVVDGDFKQYKILTDDGKTWHKHKVLDEVQIIKPGKLDE